MGDQNKTSGLEAQDHPRQEVGWRSPNISALETVAASHTGLSPSAFFK